MSIRRKDSVSSVRKSRGSSLEASITLKTNEELPKQDTIVFSDNEERDLMLFLKQHGYKWGRGIYIGEGDNALLTYAKVSILGHKLYVELDSSYSNIKPQKRDLSIKQVLRVKKEVVDDEERAEKCSAMDVCGTAYECEDGFCTLRRNEETMEVEEEDFYITTERQNKSGFTKDPALARPIVKISEIIANNNEVIRNVITASNRLRVKADYSFFKRQMDFNTAVDNLQTVATNVDNLLSKAFANVISINKKTYSKTEHISIPPLAQEEEEYNNVMGQLEDVSTLKTMLIADSAYLQHLTDRIDEIIKELEDLNEDVADRYC